MGAQWKQAGREANAQKRGQMVVKLVREIMVAAKLGGADPDLNARLAAAVEKARKSSVTRDTIERAIKKGRTKRSRSSRSCMKGSRRTRCRWWLNV
jgi:transcriptional/translational regulatory protein YebC/TACO1